MSEGKLHTIFCLFLKSSKVFSVSLSKETANMPVLDSECTKTICREKWLTWYLELRTDERKSDASFRFGDNEGIKIIKSVEIPARIVGQFTSIKAEQACD